MRQMKDSGIPWIGIIPEFWAVSKIKYNLHREEPRNPGGVPVLSLYRDYGVIPKDSRDDNHNVTSEDTSKYKYVRVGDFVINKMKAWQGSVSVSKYEGIVSPAYFVYRFDNQDLVRDYFHYLIRACYKDEFRRLSGGIREGQWDLPSEALDNTLIILPPVKEQQRIADFLDDKCAEIDALTTDIQKEIEMLQEYRRSLITEAVTKGLDPDAEMKDSGIEWIDSIPVSWDITRIGYESWIRARLGWKGLKADEYVDEGYPFLSAFNIVRNKLDWDSLNYIDEFRYEESPEIKLKVGDLILVKDGAGIGKCARIDELPFGPSTTNGSLAVISPGRKLEYRFLHFYLQSAMFQNYIIRMMNGMGVPHLSQEELRKIVIPLPPIEVQKSISDYLDLKCADIDQSIKMKEKQIETIADYRKSLIYEYVTGKKEVV